MRLNDLYDVLGIRTEVIDIYINNQFEESFYGINDANPGLKDIFDDMFMAYGNYEVETIFLKDCTLCINIG